MGQLFVVLKNMNIERHASDRIAIRYLGCFAEQGRTDDIFVNPGHLVYLHCCRPILGRMLKSVSKIASV